jgi:hypothetical protein
MEAAHPARDGRPNCGSNFGKVNEDRASPMGDHRLPTKSTNREKECFRKEKECFRKVHLDEILDAGYFSPVP